MTSEIKGTLAGLALGLALYIAVLVGLWGAGNTIPWFAALTGWQKFCLVLTVTGFFHRANEVSKRISRD